MLICHKRKPMELWWDHEPHLSWCYDHRHDHTIILILSIRCWNKYWFWWEQTSVAPHLQTTWQIKHYILNWTELSSSSHVIISAHIIEAHSPSCLKSSVKFPQSVMICGAMSSAGVGPLCFLKTNVTAPVYQEILEHFMLPSNQLFKDADFIFQQDLAPAHTAKSTKGCINDHGVLDWPANSPNLNPIQYL